MLDTPSPIIIKDKVVTIRLGKTTDNNRPKDINIPLVCTIFCRPHFCIA